MQEKTLFVFAIISCHCGGQLFRESKYNVIIYEKELTTHDTYSQLTPKCLGQHVQLAVSCLSDAQQVAGGSVPEPSMLK